jgi:hypothetical protein
MEEDECNYEVRSTKHISQASFNAGNKRMERDNIESHNKTDREIYDEDDENSLEKFGKKLKRQNDKRDNKKRSASLDKKRRESSSSLNENVDSASADKKRPASSSSSSSSLFCQLYSRYRNAPDSYRAKLLNDGTHLVWNSIESFVSSHFKSQTEALEDLLDRFNKHVCTYDTEIDEEVNIQDAFSVFTRLLTKNVSSFEGSETHYNPSSPRSSRRDSVITNGASPYKLDQSTPGPTTPHMFSGNPTVNQSTSSLIYGNPTADQSEDPATALTAAPTRKRSSAHATNSLITSGTPTDQTKNKRRQTDLYTFLKK